MAAQRADKTPIGGTCFGPSIEQNANLVHPFVAHVTLYPGLTQHLIVLLLDQHLLFDCAVGNLVRMVISQIVVTHGAPYKVVC